MRKQQSFEVDEDVRALHQEGIDLSKTDFIGAQAAYAGAMEMLRLGQADLDGLSTRMHMARLLRDDGFLHVRKALAADTKDPGLELYRGIGQLFTSLTISRLMKERQAPRYSPEAWYSLRAEHGATQGAIGRLGTVAAVLSEELELNTTSYYIHAHEDLNRGSNRYYETSNAINAARHLTVIGQLGRVSIWRNRAGRSVEAARKFNDPNYKAAKDTFNKRKNYLKSPEIAVESVKAAP